MDSNYEKLKIIQSKNCKKLQNQLKHKSKIKFYNSLNVF